MLSGWLWAGECQGPSRRSALSPTPAQVDVRRGVGAGGGSASRAPLRGRAGASFVLLPARDPEAPGAPSPGDASGSAVPAGLCGIDHAALSKQVAEYKRRKGQGRGSPACAGAGGRADQHGKEDGGHSPPGRGPMSHEPPVRGSE